MVCGGCWCFGAREGVVLPGSIAGVVFAPDACPLAWLRLLCAYWRVSEEDPAEQPWAPQRSGAWLAAASPLSLRAVPIGSP